MNSNVIQPDEQPPLTGKLKHPGPTAKNIGEIISDPRQPIGFFCNSPGKSPPFADPASQKSSPDL